MPFKTHLNRKIAIIFLITVLFIIIFYVPYNEDKVVFTDFWFELNNESVDFTIFVDYTSKGAFIAGEVIHVDVKLIGNNDEFMNSTHRFTVVFENSILKSMPKSGPYPITGLIIMDMSSTNSDTVVGSVDLYYPNPGKYSYHFVVNQGLENEQFIFPDKNITTPLHVAPLETRLQIKNNDLMLRLTLVIIIFTLVQIFLTYTNK